MSCSRHGRALAPAIRLPAALSPDALIVPWNQLGGAEAATIVKGNGHFYGYVTVNCVAPKRTTISLQLALPDAVLAASDTNRIREASCR